MSSTASYDWAPPRTAHAFTGYLQAGPDKAAGLVVRMALHTPIPKTAADWQESGMKRIVGTILGFPKLGFVSAPYTKKPAKSSKYQPPKDPAASRPQPLLEPVETSQGEVTAVKVYNFHKANSTFDKGDRDESSVSVLAVGQAFTYMISEYLYEKTVFADGSAGFIPAFSVVEIQLNPSHNQSGGYGVKIARIRAQAHSLYSLMGCAGALDRIQKSADAALEFVREQAKLCEPVCNNLEQARYGFYCSVDPTARVVDVRDDLEFVRIECPLSSGNSPAPGVQCVDVAHEDLMRFTNFPGDLVAARTLVDLAIAAGSLRMFVTFNDYYNKEESVLSQFRGVPLVDCASFLTPVQEGELETQEEAVTFPADWRVPHDPQLQSVAIRVGTIPREQEEGELSAEDNKHYAPPPCPDMPLVSPSCSFGRGYRVLVGNPGSGDQDADDAYYVLEAYFNAGRAAGAGGGLSGSGAAGGVTGYKRVKI
jgi:hypothetical protein